MRLAVSPEHRPTLSDLLAPLPTIARRAIGGALLLAALFVVALVLRARSDEISVVREEPFAFNFRRTEAMEPVKARAGEIMRFEHSRRGTFVQSFALLPLELPSYEGDVGGALPVFAAAEIAALRERYSQFELIEEGKARVNETPGYTIAFRARLGERRLYGREVIVPEPVPGSRTGVRLLLESTPAAGVARAEDVGARGQNKLPYRSFRFGTEGP